MEFRKLHLIHTDYEYMPPVDVDFTLIRQYVRPVIVCAREQQKIRLCKLLETGILPMNTLVAGWWDFGGMPMDSILTYDGVFILDPERIGDEKAKEQWMRVVQCLTT